MMSQNQEIIESKLCAYIDGELDPEGRAEIERHLEANPQHRRLLESLRATRDLIRWLPREPAPPEVAETLSGQLERSVLLNDEGDSLRISPWPRIMAAAAIILLTAGLGVAVYYVLPRSQKSAQLAFHSNSPDSTGDVVPAPTTAELARNDVSDTPEAEHGALREVDKMKAATPEDLRKEGRQVAAKGGFDAKDAKQVELADADKKNVAELDQLAVQVGQDPAAYLASAANPNNNANNVVSQTALSANSNSSPMVLLVRSDAPERTQKQLTSYLNEQQIQWRQAPLQIQADSLSRSGTGTVGLNRADLERMQESVEKRESNRRTLATTQKVDVAEDDVLNGPMPSGATATTRPAQPQDFAVAIAPPASQAKREMQNGYAEQRQAGLTNNASFNSVYVCQMSRRQAAELSNTIGNDSVAGTQVQDVNSVAYNTNSQQSATQNSSALEIARARSPLAGGYGAGGSAGIQQQHRSLDSTLADRSNQMARRSIYSKAGQRDEAATTRPAEASALAVNDAPQVSGKQTFEPATTQTAGPGAAPAGGAMPATDPSQAALAATTGPVDEPVNVVIMVQPNATTPPAAPPATQPSGQIIPQKAQEAPSQPQPALK